MDDVAGSRIPRYGLQKDEGTTTCETAPLYSRRNRIWLYPPPYAPTAEPRVGSRLWRREDIDRRFMHDDLSAPATSGHLLQSRTISAYGPDCGGVPIV